MTKPQQPQRGRHIFAVRFPDGTCAVYDPSANAVLRCDIKGGKPDGWQRVAFKARRATGIPSDNAGGNA